MTGNISRRLAAAEGQLQTGGHTILTVVDPGETEAEEPIGTADTIIRVFTGVPRSRRAA